MENHESILREALIVALGEAAAVALMLGVFALLDRFDRTVLWGGLVGGALATANFLLMGLGVNLAADRAENQNVKGGQAAVTASFLLRFGLLILVLFLAARSGKCNIFALVIPLLFPRLVLALRECFRRKGEKKG